jgi:hypothetical protein
MSGVKKIKWSLLLIPMLILGCSDTSVNPTSTIGIPSDLQEQLDRTKLSNTTSANNALVQAKLQYSQLVGRWNSISPVDTDAYLETKEKLLSPMFIVVNSLSSDTSTSSEKTSLINEFKTLYFDSLTQMMKGVNNNLLVYQATLETSQIINSNETNSLFTNTSQSLQDLAGIFLATETIELFSSQLGQFNTITSNDETQAILGGIKNQQTTIINGIVNFTNTGKITKNEAKQAYITIVKSLTSPNLLNMLGNLAISVFGKNNVAFIQNELTPSQPNPNLTVMLIKEDETTYRSISIDSSNKIVNKISNDNRGLSASDLLNNSNVNIIRTSNQPISTVK